MTLEQVYRAGKKELEKAGLDSPAFDAMCLFRQAFGMDRQALIMEGAAPAEEAKAAAFEEAVRQRAEGRPLQYILGRWPFLDMELRVGEGVLTPREETELLVRTAAGLLRRQQPACGRGEGLSLLDLCAGTGAVALGLAGEFPAARVQAAEWYPQACEYLQENIRLTGRAVESLRLDVLDPASPEAFSGLALLTANPPYVASGEIPSLQREVQREPRTALDGGGDGLLFYRAIAARWLACLAPGGVCAVEIGEGQGEAVTALFRSAGLEQTEIFQDFNRLDRVVAGIKGK